MSDIAELIPQGYLPPYGTPLTLSAFQAKPQGWEITAFDADGVETTYSIPVPDGETRVAAIQLSPPSEGTLKCRDVYSKRLSTKATPVQWVDWILTNDADYRTGLSNEQWEGSDDVALMDEQEENLANFKTLGEFQAWLDEVLEPTDRKLIAFEVTEFPERGETRKIAVGEPDGTTTSLEEWADPLFLMRRDGRGREPDQGPLYKSFSQFHTRLGGDFWWNWPGTGNNSGEELRHMRPKPQLDFWDDDYWADYYISLELLRERTTLNEAPETVNPKAGAWWGLRLADTDHALAFPSRGTNVIIDYHANGRQLSVNARATDYRATLNKANEAHYRQWGKFRDPDATLTPEEVEAGIAAAEKLIGEL